LSIVGKSERAEIRFNNLPPAADVDFGDP